MKNKLFLTEADRKQILANKEKIILENFAKTFNKIKRIDENEINRVKNWKQFLNENDEYNFDNAKNNPNIIVVKFAPGGYDKFWNQYIKSGSQNWHYFQSWVDLASSPSLSPNDAKGLKMRDGVYYLLFKIYDPEDKSRWYSSGKKYLGKESLTPPATFYFLKYNKEAGEIGIASCYGTEYSDIVTNDEFFDTNLKCNLSSAHCIIKNKDGKEYRTAEVGSIDNLGYFEIVSVN